MVIAFDDMRTIAISLEQRLELGARDSSKHGWIGDLVAIQVQDWQDRAVGGGVQKLVGVPRCRERSGLRFSVAYDARHQQLRVVQRGADRVRQRVTKLATLMDR